ncbi:GTP-binding protein [Streptomyces sp. NPDC056405]|uniref:GTP-binding protein n=1 Tax=Streptomyces sp. NPDC056405 TaxID=3345811 RepID=UPI0035E30CE6
MRGGGPESPRRDGGVLNIGVLAHVDAGKTSLTEQLLFACGALRRIGSVDDGTTQTDSEAIERARGITIRSAVACYRDGERQFNLVDTPGHADFVAEVERSLMAVDAVILVIAAPEGVQPQTRVLHRVVERLRLPVVVFVNKIDSAGAAGLAVLEELSAKLGLRPVATGVPLRPGTPRAEFVSAERCGPETARHWAEILAENDDELLERVVSGHRPDHAQLLAAMRAQTRACTVQPVVFGSAITGAGIDGLRWVLGNVLEPPPDRDQPVGTVFAIARNERGEKTALVRCFGGELAERQQVDVYRADGSSFRDRVRNLKVLGPDDEEHRALTAGHIASVGGPAGLRIGDHLGRGRPPRSRHHFPAPSLEVSVRPMDPGSAPALRAALRALDERDPMIHAEMRAEGEAVVHLYGHVQQEVLQQTLGDEFGVKAIFELPDIVHLERPVGRGSAVEIIGNGFLATVGLRTEPGDGFTYRREVESGALPAAFHDAVEETVRSALSQGCHGWRVVDIDVTMTHCGFWARPYSAAGDFRAVTPHVLMQALAQSDTRVYEPMHRFWVETPENGFGALINCLNRHEAEVENCRQEPDRWVIEGRIPLRTLGDVRQRVMPLTNGSALWSSYADGDRAVAADPPPSHPRTDGNPFDRVEYLRFLARREAR